MKKNRLISLLLALLLACGGCLTGCGDIAVEETTAAPIETTAAETGEARLDPGLPKLDLEGYTITFFGKDVSGVWEEETTGDVVVDAIYNRNILLEDTYNFKLHFRIAV